MSILHALKMAWMVFWRVALFTFLWGPDFGMSKVILLGLIVGFVLRFVFRINIKSFPIIRLIFRKPVVQRFDKVVAAPKVSPSNDGTDLGDNSTKFNNIEVISKPSAVGVMTGFEPRVLDKVSVPTTPYMRGVPGVGLDSSGMNKDNIRAGKKGEVNFAKALGMITVPSVRGEYNKIIDNVNSFWSVAMPSENDPSRPDPKYKTDIDSIIVSGNSIVLIDTKFYASGDVTYTSEGNKLYCVDNQTGKMVNQPRTMSKNMSMALQRFTKHYPDMEVSAVVVFMPTDSGSANINAVWTGGIKTVNIQQMIAPLTAIASDTGITVKNMMVLNNLSMLRQR